MTKAKTVGARRRGRKRIDVPRQPNGQPKRSAAASSTEAMRPVLERRCATMGWRPTDANMVRARDNRLSTLPGRLLVAGMIQEHQYLGLMSYADTYARWLRAIDAPSPWPKCARLGEVGGETLTEAFLVEKEADRVWRRADAYMAALGALRASGCEAAVTWVFSQSDDVGPSRASARMVRMIGLAGDAMARHFRVPVIEKEG